MKKVIAFALNSVLVAVPAFADDTVAIASTGKRAPTTASGNKHGHKTAAAKDECATEHGYGHPIQ